MQVEIPTEPLRIVVVYLPIPN